MRTNSDSDSRLIKTSVRMPAEVLADLKAVAKENGRTMNEEILARVLEAENRATFKLLVKQNDELRALMREMLDQIEMLKR